MVVRAPFPVGFRYCFLRFRYIFSRYSNYVIVYFRLNEIDKIFKCIPVGIGLMVFKQNNIIGFSPTHPQHKYLLVSGHLETGNIAKLSWTILIFVKLAPVPSSRLHFKAGCRFIATAHGNIAEFFLQTLSVETSPLYCPHLTINPAKFGFPVFKQLLVYIYYFALVCI